MYLRLGSDGYSGSVQNVTVADCPLTSNYTALYLRDGHWTVKDSIVADNTTCRGVYPYSTSSLTFENNNVYNNNQNYYSMADPTGTNGNISQDPLFTSGDEGNYYLSHVATGQAQSSPSIDAGSDTAENIGLGETAGYSTRTDEVYDAGTVDMGYHYGSGEGDWITQIVIPTEEQEIIQGDPSEEIVIELQNEAGEATETGVDVIIQLVSSSAGGSFSLSKDPWTAITEVTIPAGSSQVTVYYKDEDAGAPTLDFLEDPSQGWTDGDYNLTVKSSVSSFSIVPAEDQYLQVAGTAFSITITALNEESAIAASYEGPVDISVTAVAPTIGTGTFTPSSSLGYTFVEGICVIANALYDDCGKMKIIVNDNEDPSKTGESNTFTFVPDDFSVTPALTQAVTSEPFELQIQALNVSDEVCQNYTGSATMSVEYIDPSEDQEGTLSVTELDSEYWVNGVAAISDLTYDKWGQIKIIVADDTVASQTGTSEEIMFTPKDFSVNIQTPPASRDFFYEEEEFSATVTARDYNETTLANYQGSITLDVDGLSGLTSPYDFISSDSGTHVFEDISGDRAGNYTLEATDRSYSTITGSSEEIEVRSGIIKVYPNSGPVGDLLVQIKLLDSDGDVISSDNSTTFTVDLEEYSNDNNSATSLADLYDVTMEDGIATITVTNTEPEQVTVSADSDPRLTSEDGIINFGSIRGTGIGIEYWREIKDERSYGRERKRKKY